MTLHRRGAGLLCSAAIGLLAAGCGGADIPELGEVSGRVTADGKPLDGVLVQFYSEAGGRPGTDVTDAEGKYELNYVGDEQGSKVGPSRVEITTEWPDGEPPPGQKEKIPEKYNATTELKADVKGGDNTFDFDLKLQ